MHNLRIVLYSRETLRGNVGRGVPPRPPKPSDPVIGLLVKATPSQELPSIYKLPGGCTWKIALKFKVNQSKNGKFTSTIRLAQSILKRKIPP